jgi:uncharacterized protein (DUF1697 family)
VPVLISLLRGINVVGANQIRMEALRKLHEQCGCRDVRTHINSGNVVFRTAKRNFRPKLIEDAIEAAVGFRPAVVLRTPAELRNIIQRNPFAGREDIHPSKLLVGFLAETPASQTAAALEELKAKGYPEEAHLEGQELFVYFPDGVGKSRFPWASLDKIFKTRSTARNWNTVTKLLQLAEELEGNVGRVARAKSASSSAQS